MTSAIRVQNLGKRYRIGARVEPHRLLSEQISAAFARPFQRGARWLHGIGTSKNGNGADPAHIWALREVNFEIPRGEAVGIIGRNGAGKSTLLKILSRITKPTEGRVELFGRVGSLLEVGTGFHPELTGRENIYLNGAILGMRRAEIARKFDEIVAFAEVEKFIDTPVKRFSSGMTVRLAFAVAAHLEPEILLVDEVLAVGDTAFQKKCLGKMGDVARDGRTVLFVSHDLTSIQVLCNRALRLSNGQVQGLGPVADEINAYLAESKFFARSQLDHPIPLSDRTRLLRFGFSPDPVPSGSPAEFDMELDSTMPLRIDDLAVVIHDGLNRRVGVLDLRQPHAPYKMNGKDTLKIRAQLRAMPLVEGEYRIGLSIRSDDVHRLVADLVTLDIVAKPDHEMVPYRAAIRGIVAFDYTLE
ncbi:MAG TPA: ABC transporter ATP-binding protein [Anaerolineae bacterium]|nr:ABC transporter ATP-binding protein [Anaerolineae bacterium]